MKYEKPAVNFTEIDLTSFICASIKDLSFTYKVEELDNDGEEILAF